MSTTLLFVELTTGPEHLGTGLITINHYHLLNLSSDGGAICHCSLCQLLTAFRMLPIYELMKMGQLMHAGNVDVDSHNCSLALTEMLEIS